MTRAVLVGGAALGMMAGPAAAQAPAPPGPPPAVAPMGLARLDGPEGLTGLPDLAGLAGLAGLGELVAAGPDPDIPLPGGRFPTLGRRLPPAAWNQQDPADSLYRAARAALSRGNAARAAELFARITERFPKSGYAADAMYWEAFARYRQGGEENLRRALALLDRQRGRFPAAATRSDAAALATRIRGELARRGDAQAAESVAAQAALAAEASPAPESAVAAVPAEPAPALTPRLGRAPRPPRAPRGYAEVPAGCPSEDDDERVAALNALMQMDAERALPVLKKVLARRDECSVTLRRKAMFLVAQQKSPETADILLQAVKSDPDPEVQRQGIFWLGQVDAERAVDVLGEVLRTSSDVELQKSAIFALSQHGSPRAAQIIRAYAEQADAPEELRSQAIFWIGQRQTGENSAFLRGLYGRLTSQRLKERVLFSLSQMREEGNARWLLDVALNNAEPIEMRKKALFWAGQNREVAVSELTGLYDKTADREMKEQLIFVYSQRREPAAVDKLLEIARKETDRDIRKKAIFWLSQSHDPRVAKFLEDLISQ